MSDRTLAVLGPHVVAADLAFVPEVVVVAYDEPFELPPLSWRWWPRGLRWSGHRRVRRAYVLRPLPIRELLVNDQAFLLLRRRRELDLTSVAAVIVGPTALYLPRRALREILEAYRRVNELGPVDEPLPAIDADAPSAMLVSFDAVLRRLERAPFHLKRDEVLDLTVRQVKARLAEFGEEKLEEVKSQLAMHGGQV